MNKYMTIPRVVCDTPLSLLLPADAEIPVRMRDDLDPCDPPAEYADGRVSWSGFATREARDTGRAARRQAKVDEEVRRQAEAKRAREARIAALTRDAWTGLKVCSHTKTIRRNERGFSCSVAGPRGDENRAAHGNITEDEFCPACACSRPLNVNGNHVEYGDWRPDRQAIEEAV